ncbi:MAG: hypothetical protein VKK03_05470 [Synechococcus sp.]|nr:hypothetical protein [Synechococcus sp.]
MALAVVFLAACGSRRDADRWGSAGEQPSPADQAQIQRCLKATGGRMPTLFVMTPGDEPPVRPTPEACRGIELKVQEAVQAKLIEDCAKATRLLETPQTGVTATQKRWASTKLRQCVGGDAKTFFW